MRIHIVQALGLAALLVAATACSSGSGPAAPGAVSTYGGSGTTSSTTGGFDPATPAAPSYRSAPAAGGPIRWHTTLADAQNEARASGKLILVMSTKPRCGLCDKFKTQIAPATAGELSRVAVGYIYDITRPEVRDVDRLLRANLRGADLMPLVGFVTADMQWVHGFWGQRSVQQFRGDIARATSIHPVRSASIRVQEAPEAARFAAVVNEFGETEWAAPEDVWPAEDPEPIDALTGAPDPLPTRIAAPAASVQAGSVQAGSVQAGSVQAGS
ncbi:MAG: hypothetical protein O2894_03690, partial [Planctomycetota bacterium]|nr:hypothetical protein [Planctomycetota bacterium]